MKLGWLFAIIVAVGIYACYSGEDKDTSSFPVVIDAAKGADQVSSQKEVCSCPNCDKPCTDGSGICICDRAGRIADALAPFIEERLGTFKQELKGELIAASDAKLTNPQDNNESIGVQSYDDAVEHVKATGESVDVSFYDSGKGQSKPRSGYACDLFKTSKQFRDYWIGNATVPAVKQMKPSGSGGIVVADWHQTHPSVLATTAKKTVHRYPGSSWTWPGDLRSHLQGDVHGYTAEELAGLSHAELKALHDNDHNGHESGLINVASPVSTTVERFVPIQTYLSGGCPGGVCPAPSSSRSYSRGGLFRRW